MPESVAFGRNWGYFRDENGPKWGTTSKWILTIFKYKNEKVEKVNEKMGLLVLKLSKKVHFLQFYADLSKKYKSFKAIYI